MSDVAPLLNRRKEMIKAIITIIDDPEDMEASGILESYVIEPVKVEDFTVRDGAVTIRNYEFKFSYQE